MTIVNIKIATPRVTGLVPAVGSMLWTPTRLHVIDDTVVVPASFRVVLTDGEATIAVDPTTLEWVWRVDEQIAGAPSRTRYLPVAAGDPVEYTDLVPIDPVTLEPAAEPEPAWWAALPTQGAPVVDAVVETDATSAATQLNALMASLRAAGVIA